MINFAESLETVKPKEFEQQNNYLNKKGSALSRRVISP